MQVLQSAVIPGQAFENLLWVHSRTIPGTIRNVVGGGIILWLATVQMEGGAGERAPGQCKVLAGAGPEPLPCRGRGACVDGASAWDLGAFKRDVVAVVVADLFE
eukprot:3402054-Amphidinium_carterae.2